MSLGQNIKQIRESMNLTIDNVVRKLGFFKSVYINIENGAVKPNTEQIKKIAKVFGINYKDILNYKNDSNLSRINKLNIKNLKDIISKSPEVENDKTIVKKERKRTFSSILLSYVEPYKYRNEDKTLFYTEFNTGLNVGDKVFIINGVYDSNDKILKNKYKTGSDGYTVLYADKCKIALDIDYTGEIPYYNEPIDDFINIYVIKTQRDFIHANRQYTTKSGNYLPKFNINQNNIIYIDSPKDTVDSEWGKSIALVDPGFYVKSGVDWFKVDDEFNGVFENTGNVLGDTNSGKIRIHDGDIIHTIGNRVLDLKDESVYRWDLDNSEWIPDVYNYPAFLSTGNFRGGDFNGVFNSGVYGSKENRIKWKNATWNTGVLLNVDWLEGFMGSKNALEKSYVSSFDENNKPYQKLNGPDNNGNGYNYIIDSQIDNINAENGTFNNTNIGSITSSVVDSYISGVTIDNVDVKKGLFNNCKFVGGKIKDSTIVNSRVNNTLFENIKSINSLYKSSVIKDSTYISDGNIKILDYDEYNIKTPESIAPVVFVTRKLYKFYISEYDYKKIKKDDFFYIKDLIINDGSKHPLNFFDKKFRISNWIEFIDLYINDSFVKKAVEMDAFLSTPLDNSYKLNYFGDDTVITSLNDKKGYSIDIIVNTKDLDIAFDTTTKELSTKGLSFNTKNEPSIQSGSSYNVPTKLGNIIDFSKSYINNSDFDGGIIENVDWISGNHINSNNNLCISRDLDDDGIYNIVITGEGLITVKTPYNNLDEASDLIKEGDIVFFKNLEYITTSTTTKIGDTFRVVSSYDASGNIVLEELITNTITMALTSGEFMTEDSHNRYNHLSKTKITKTKIHSGIFRRSYITDSFIENTNLNILDKDFDNMLNIKGLVISDSILKNDNNILSKAVYMNSSFTIGSNRFVNGVVYNSTWDNMEFENGLFKESAWLKGDFIKGIFYNNRSFDGDPNTIYDTNIKNRVRSYYRNGEVSDIIANDNHSWISGNFLNGEFYKSDFVNGEFLGGKFYHSKFYDGVIKGGNIGDEKIPMTNTRIYNGVIEYTTVDNADLFCTDFDLGYLTQREIIWKDGVFNGGRFASNGTNISIWKNGIFNEGDFESKSIWENGTFNGGRFLSSLGEPTLDEDYTWRNGVFNDGQFGNSDLTLNASWLTGQFNGGVFVGRVWADGILTNGTFKGSALGSATKDVKRDSSNANDFVVDYRSGEYYGRWIKGIVSPEKDSFINDKIYTKLIRSGSKRPVESVQMENMLWEGGVFNHSSGIFDNSVWLDGTFKLGKFYKSSFNPYVIRTGTVREFNKSDTCVWLDGYLIDSDFYISKWHRGKFDTGDGYGMIWKDGTCNYMNAFNIYWEKGLWRNGNWYGSYMDFNGNMIDILDPDPNPIDHSFYRDILENIVEYKHSIGITDEEEKRLMHIWNIFSEGTISGDTIGDVAKAIESN